MFTLFEGDLGNTGGWGPYHPISDMMYLWANILDTPDMERSYLPDTNPNDGSIVRLDVYTSPDHGLELWYYLVGRRWS